MSEMADMEVNAERFITGGDLEDLERACRLLENPGLAVKMTDIIGSPIETGMKVMPKKWASLVGTVTEKSLLAALHFAVFTLDGKSGRPASELSHKLAVMGTGAVGGAFGLAAIAAELPVTTVIMFRSIAQIARSEGENIKELEAKLACLEVFALGSNKEDDNASETGYFAVRYAMSQAVSEAAKYIAEKGITKKTAPAIMRFIASIASRFGIAVSEKTVAQAVPVLGALGGATINTIFMKHFQDMARGHFIVRRLERRYGRELVQAEYERIRRDIPSLKRRHALKQ